MIPSTEAKSFSPTSNVRKKIGNKVNMNDVFTPDKIKECQSIIQKAHESFFNDVLEIWQLIINDFAELAENSKSSSQIIQRIAKHSLEIKGKLDAVGYGLGMKIAKSLHDFALNDTTPQKHMVIYGKHIDAMNTVIRSNLKGDGGVMGNEIMKALSALIKKLN